MNAVVPEFAGAIVPVPMPLIMKAVTVERLQRSGAEDNRLAVWSWLTFQSYRGAMAQAA